MNASDERYAVSSPRAQAQEVVRTVRHEPLLDCMSQKVAASLFRLAQEVDPEVPLEGLLTNPYRLERLIEQAGTHRDRAAQRDEAKTKMREAALKAEELEEANLALLERVVGLSAELQTIAERVGPAIGEGQIATQERRPGDVARAVRTLVALIEDGFCAHDCGATGTCPPGPGVRTQLREAEARFVAADPGAPTFEQAGVLPPGDARVAQDPRFTLCICPGCGWTGMRRPVEEDEGSAAESYCTACGCEADAPPYRLPSVDELARGEAGQWSRVDLSAFVPALLRALRERGPADAKVEP